MGLVFDDPGAGAAAPAAAPPAAAAAAQPPQKPGFFQRLEKRAEARFPIPKRAPEEAKQAGAQFLPQQNRYESSEEQYARETAGANAFFTPGQMAGEYTTEKTAPYIGQEPAKLVGAGVSGLVSPMPEVSALPRIGYGVASEAGRWAASPVSGALTRHGHPYAATGVDIAAQLAPVLGAEPAWRALSGKTDIAAAAKTAAQKAVEAGEKEHGGLVEQAGAETLAEQEAAAKGRAGAQAAAETELAKAKGVGEKRAVGVTGAATEAQQGMPGVQQAAQAKASAASEELRAKLLKQAQPEAREETITGILGKPSDPTMEQGPERIARGEEFRQTTSQPLQRWRSEWRLRRDSAIEPFKNERVDDAPLRERVLKEQTQWLPTHRPYSPKVQQFLDQMAAEQQVGPSNEELLKQLPPEIQRNYSPQQLQQLVEQDRARWIKQHPEEAAAPNQPKVSELIAAQEQANTMARAAKGADRTALNQVVRGIDDTLATIDAPNLKKINAEYADHRVNFPYEFEDKMRGAARPVDVAGDIFNQPQRALDLAKLSNPQERAHLAGLYRDWVAEKGVNVVSKEHAPFLKYMYPGTPLAKPEAWIYEDKAVNNLGEMFARAPQANARFTKALDDAHVQYKRESAEEIWKAGWKDADPKNLGPAGYRIRRLIDAAKTSEEKAQVAVDQFKQLNPQQAGTEAGGIAQRNYPQTARQAAQSYQPEPFRTTARDKLAGYQPPDPETAAVGAITKFKPPSGIWERWKWRAEFWTLMAGGAMATGHAPLRTAIFGLMAGAPLGARELISAGYRYSLRDPESALKFYRAVTNPGVESNLDHIARSVIKAQVAQRMGNPSVPGEVKPPPSTGTSPRTPGPMSQDISRKQAVAMASERGRQDPTHVDQVEDLNKQIAMGSTPNIHQDLTTGRLSNTEVRKMVQPEQTASLFQGMNLPDAFEAWSKGSPEEKQMALAPLAQKLNDEGKNLSPVQRRQMMARLQQELGDQGEGGEGAAVA